MDLTAMYPLVVIAGDKAKVGGENIYYTNAVSILIRSPIGNMHFQG